MIVLFSISSLRSRMFYYFVIVKNKRTPLNKFLKFFIIGMNQLLWYYADLEKRKCYHASDELPDFDNQEKACSIWRRFAKYKD